MPDSCWESCITIPIMRGNLRVGEEMSSIMEKVDSDCCACCSAFISSISSSMSFDPLSFFNAVNNWSNYNKSLPVVNLITYPIQFNFNLFCI